MDRVALPPLADTTCGSAGHALQIPLAAIFEYLDLLDGDGLLNDPAALRGYLAAVRGQAAVLARLVVELTAAPIPTTSADAVPPSGADPSPDRLSAGPGSAPSAPIRDDAQTLLAIRDLRRLRRAVARERTARELAEAQQIRAVRDFRASHDRAKQLAERLDQAYLETITALARSIEARDGYTGLHVERVRRYSLRLASDLRLGDDAIRRLEFGAVLHDVGKIGIGDAILSRPGPLDPAEWQVMRRHPEIGRRVLEGIAFLTPALDAVFFHHERWDGEGYPGGLAGEAIPLAGRIVAIVDAYDAMTTDRPYRRALPREAALAEIERGRGTQFDPDVARVFLANPPVVGDPG